MKKISVWILASIFVLSMVALPMAQDKPKVPAWQTTVVKDWVAKAKAEVKKVGIAEVKAAIDKKEKAYILDVRDPDEFKAGHLPGAIHVSRGKLEFVIWDKIQDKEAKIYVYCLTSARSALATKTLYEMGYKNAILMDAHFEEWIKAGYPVER
jgi:rhodanese-related sulfurtransferase